LVYIHAPHEHDRWAPGAASRWGLHHTLASLERDLHARGSRLLVRQGDSLAQLRQIIAAHEVKAVYWSRLYEPALLQRDHNIEMALRADGIEVYHFRGNVLNEPWTVLNRSNTPYKVFTPYWNACRERDVGVLLPTPTHIPAPAQWPDSLPLKALKLCPSIPWDSSLAHLWEMGEYAAQARLRHFITHTQENYAQMRDIPAHDGVSRLSPYLHFGAISVRHVLYSVDAEAFKRQLFWREFALQLLFHVPHTVTQALNSRFEHFPWREDNALLHAWQRGHTGFPLVDAGMRELWQSGWMHNRVRMLCASFLCKNALISWQRGADWFWDTLIDADLANNTLGWQWVAGCGADAAPYQRVFNPILQAQRFDSHGEYIRRWIPELRQVKDEFIHNPHNSGIRLDYPLPCFDLKATRTRYLNLMQNLKKT
jgi:deoxyribodipyrimidine photo-lyase